MENTPYPGLQFIRSRAARRSGMSNERMPLALRGSQVATNCSSRFEIHASPASSDALHRIVPRVGAPSRPGVCNRRLRRSPIHRPSREISGRTPKEIRTCPSVYADNSDRTHGAACSLNAGTNSTMLSASPECVLAKPTVDCLCQPSCVADFADKGGVDEVCRAVDHPCRIAGVTNAIVVDAARRKARDVVHSQL